MSVNKLITAFSVYYSVHLFKNWVSILFVYMDLTAVHVISDALVCEQLTA